MLGVQDNSLVKLRGVPFGNGQFPTILAYGLLSIHSIYISGSRQHNLRSYRHLLKTLCKSV